MTNCLEIMRQHDRETMARERFLAKIIGSRLLSRFWSENAGRTMKHKDQWERTWAVWPISFGKNTVPIHFHNLLAVSIGTEMLGALRLSRNPNADQAEYCGKDDSQCA